jgi:hypothetical protein
VAEHLTVELVNRAHADKPNGESPKIESAVDRAAWVETTDCYAACDDH